MKKNNQTRATLLFCDETNTQTFNRKYWEGKRRSRNEGKTTAVVRRKQTKSAWNKKRMSQHLSRRLCGNQTRKRGATVQKSIPFFSWILLFC